MSRPALTDLTQIDAVVRRVVDDLNPSPLLGDQYGTDQGPSGIRGDDARTQDGGCPAGRRRDPAREAIVLQEPRAGGDRRRQGRGSLARGWSPSDCLTADGRLFGLSWWVWVTAAAVALACHFVLTIKGF